MPEPSPIKVDLPAGRHAICACGHTANAPFCDGSHRGRGVTPLRLDLEAPERFAWCTCATSATRPRCDGSHRALWPPAPPPAPRPPGA